MRDAVPPCETTGGAEQVRDAGTAPPPEPSGSRVPTARASRTAPDDRPADPAAALHGPADPLDAEVPAGITAAPRDLTDAPPPPTASLCLLRLFTLHCTRKWSAVKGEGA